MLQRFLGNRIAKNLVSNPNCTLHSRSLLRSCNYSSLKDFKYSWSNPVGIRSKRSFSTSLPSIAPPTLHLLENWIKKEVSDFKPQVSIDSTWTPPNSWYIYPDFLAYEKEKIFLKSWQWVGLKQNLSKSGDFVSGTLLGEPYLVIRGSDGQLRAFYNICRHHATILTTKTEGNQEKFECCYHGWTYGLDGRLLKATKLKGIKDFNAKDFGLKPLPVAEWGPYVYVWLGNPNEATSINDLMKPVTDRLNEMKLGDLDDLIFVERKTHLLNCNWKVKIL
jgi:choline monooxygenase